MKEVYIFSGLGADERVFKFINLEGYEVTFVKWIKPFSSESIEAYTQRLLSQIDSRTPILIGLSFGGMIAVEISKHVNAEKIILVSSAKTRREIPRLFRWAGFFRLHKIIPTRLLKRSNRLVDWYFGATTKSEKMMLKEILRDTDPVFLEWAVDKIVRWKSTSAPINLIHIHGTADKLLPMTNCDFEIQGGGHLMILNKAEEISRLLQRILT